MKDASTILPNLEVYPPEIDASIARQIRVVGLDVDGVLTDGGIYLGATSEADSHEFEFKRYDIQDGLGIHLLREAGIHVVIITGRVSKSVVMRAQELGVTRLVQDKHARKLQALTNIVRELGCTFQEVAFVGDDLPDLSVLRVVGLPVAVGNAVNEVKRAARLKLSASGGHGAVREFAEKLLQARGEWIDAVERYVSSKSTLVEVPNT